MGGKKKTTASHLLLYISLIVYFIVALAGLVSAGYMIYVCEYEYAWQLFVGLFGFCGVCGSCTIAFYCNKAKAENEIMLQNAKNDKLIELAKEVCVGVRNGEIDKDAVTILRCLIANEDINDVMIETTDCVEGEG